MFCAMTRLMRARWARPYYRLAELSTLAFLPFALVTLLLIYGYARNELFYWLTNPPEHASPWLSGRWLLIRNLLGLLLFYGLSAVYLIKSLKPDLPAARAGEDDPRTTERQLYLLSPWVLVAFVICNTFFAWDFGMMLIPHWHSTVFPIHFWFGNVFAGTAALILFPALLGRAHFGPESDPQPRHAAHRICAHVAVLLLGAVLRDLVRQPAARVRAAVAADVRTLRSLLLDDDGWLFLRAVCSVHLRDRQALAGGDVRHRLAINMGIWFNKYLIVVPALSPDDRPFDSWLDVSISLGLAAGFIAAVVLLARRIPAFSRWEMDLPPEATRRHES